MFNAEIADRPMEDQIDSKSSGPIFEFTNYLLYLHGEMPNYQRLKVVKALNINTIPN